MITVFSKIGAPRRDPEPKPHDRPAASPILKEVRKLVYCEPGFSDQRSRGAFGQFLVVRNGKQSIRRLCAPEDDVAPVLFVDFVPDFSKRLDRLGPRNDRQFHPPETSMTSSSMLGAGSKACPIG